jgi:hypothetical protein
VDDQGTNPYRSDHFAQEPAVFRFPWYATIFHVTSLGTCLGLGVYFRGIENLIKFCISSSIFLFLPFLVAATLAALPKLLFRPSSFKGNFCRALAFTEIALGCFMALLAFLEVMYEIGDPLGIVPSWF